MADIRVLYINAESFQQEHSEATDSIRMASFKTANNELTDTALEGLVTGIDASALHHHDGRYYRENEHIATSSGAADASKPIITDATGKLDQTLINVAGLNASLDHGALTGLADDDHLQYLRTDGTRDITGPIKYSSLISIDEDTQLVHKKYVTDLIAGQEWFDSALTRAIDPTTITPSAGDRYLIDASMGTPTGAFAGQENKVAEWNGTGWTFQTPSTGTYISVDDEDSRIYLFSGSSWDAKEFESTTASTGLVKVGKDIQVAPTLAGNGLTFTAGVLDVKVDTVGIQIDADTLKLANAGVKLANIDFGTGANQVKAGDIPLVDSTGYFAVDNVEAALSQLAANIIDLGVEYTVGAGGVSKGDLLYITGNNTVSKLSNLAIGEYSVGVAIESKAAAETVKALQNDTVLKGVLTGAVAGTKYFWTGTGYATTMPSGAGQNVWQVGVAKNATDLHVEIRHIKKNA